MTPIKQNGTGTIIQLPGGFKMTVHDKNSGHVIVGAFVFILIMIALSTSGWIAPKIFGKTEMQDMVAIESGESMTIEAALAHSAIEDNTTRILKLETNDKEQSETLARLDERQKGMDRKLDKVVDHILRVE